MKTRFSQTQQNAEIQSTQHITWRQNISTTYTLDISGCLQLPETRNGSPDTKGVLDASGITPITTFTDGLQLHSTSNCMMCVSPHKNEGDKSQVNVNGQTADEDGELFSPLQMS